MAEHVRRHGHARAGRRLRASRTSALLTAVVASTVALVASGAPAQAAFVGTKLGSSNFEIDTSANFKQDAAAPSIDWLTSTGAVRGVIQPDAINGTGDNAFGGGTAEDQEVPTLKEDSIPPNKSDLTNFGSFQETVGTRQYLHLLWTRVQDPKGSTNMDFEFNKSSTLSSNGVTPVRSEGDLLIEYHLENGGSVASLSVRTWDNTAKAWRAEQALGTNAIGSINTAAITAPDAGAFGAKSARTFGEATLDLTALFPAGSCVNFGYAYLKSRASDSFSSEIKDFTTPANVNISNCGTIIVNKTAQNGNNTFPFTGATSSGATLPTGFSSFSLATTNGAASRTFTNVPQGTYTVTEGTEPAQWSFVGLDCSATTGSGTSAAQAGSTTTANITLAPGGVASCTWTNAFSKLSPTIATSVNGTTAPGATANLALNGTAFDTATLTGASSDADGTVTYRVYKKNANDNLCTTLAVAGTDINAQPAAVTVASGVVPNSASVTFLKAGSYWFQAVYSGDAKNNPATSPCTSEPVAVAQATPTASTAQHLTPNDSFTLAGGSAPTGTITFQLFAPTDATCSGTPAYTQVVPVNGNGTYDTTNTGASAFVASTVGTWRWLDVYSGDGNNAPMTSACGVERFTISNT